MAARPVYAQTLPQQPVSEILPNLFGNTIVLAPSGTPEFPSHSAHFKPSAEQLQTPPQFNEQIVTLLSTFPFGSSSGGFTYTFDPALGTFSSSSDSFGPLFMERALTIGSERGSLGMGYQRSTYDTFEGKNLRQPRDQLLHPAHRLLRRDGRRRAGRRRHAAESGVRGGHHRGGVDARICRPTRWCSPARTGSPIGSISASPCRWSRVDMSAASIRARIERLATAANPDVHLFDGDNPDERTFGSSGTATGLGDIVIRSKYNFFKRGGGGLAAAMDVRTPTGDESNLLGTGGLQARLFGIASMTAGKWSPHVNAGYTASTGGGLPGVSLKDEWSYAGGSMSRSLRRLTLLADLLGRTILDAGRFEEADRVFEFVATGTGSVGGGGGGGGGGAGGGGGGAGGSPPRPPTRVTRRELQFRPGNLHLLVGNFGARFNPVRSLLVSANLLFPLTSAGLRDRVTPAISVDYSF